MLPTRHASERSGRAGVIAEPRSRTVFRAAAVAWAGWFLLTALERWRLASVCAMVCGPFAPIESADDYRRAFDWQTPLLLAALPFAVLGIVRIACLPGRRRGPMS